MMTQMSAMAKRKSTVTAATRKAQKNAKNVDGLKT